MQAKSSETPEEARLSIPTSLESSADFKARLGNLLGEAHTHVYIDTSFLMWATKIGPASRGELLEWLRTDLGDRAHVPTWTAHEYLRHHVAGTIVEELNSKSAELKTLVSGSFTYFRPFLDDPALPAAEGYERLRASARDAINTFEHVIKSAKDWQQAYRDHANQIIEYINERVLEVGSLYDDVAKIATEGAARYEGRIPPGFQDRHKKGVSAEHQNEYSKDGANRYGDLIFWREAIGHARVVSAKAIIILTNDLKNDWRMGGETNANIEAGMRRPPPRIHPMLALEAKTVGIADVALLNSQYLAGLLRDVDETRVASFADVAIIPNPPRPQSEDERRAEAKERRELENEKLASAQAAAAAALAADNGYLFADDPAVVVTTVKLTRALLESRKEPDERAELLLTKTRNGVDDYARLTEILDQEAIAGMDQNLLAQMARSLHDRVLDNSPGYEETLADLGGMLPEIPPSSASALTLGLMASMYLEPGSGTSRIPPRSPIARLLLDAPYQSYGELPAQVIAKRLSANDRRPLHMPLETTVECHFETDSEASESDLLHSLKVSGVEVLLAAQIEPALLLRNLIGAAHGTGTEILRAVAELFGLPFESMDAVGDDQSGYLIPEGMGFKDPTRVFRAKEETDG